MEDIAAMMTAESGCAKCPDPCFVDVQELPPNFKSKITMNEPLYGTVSSHKWHIVFTSGTSFTKWPAHMDEDPESFTSSITESLDHLSDKVKSKFRVSAITRGPASGGYGDEEVDIMIFPERVVYRSVTREQLDNLFTYHMLQYAHDKAAGTVSPAVGRDFPAPEPIKEQWVFICGHKLRDNRCGIIAPILREQFEAVFEKRGMKDIEIDLISHVGGHKFAGNIIIETTHDVGAVWYGRVFPEHVDNIVYTTLIKGEILKPLLRGKTGDW